MPGSQSSDALTTRSECLWWNQTSGSGGSGVWEQSGVLDGLVG